ncbi:MAG: hypothetical protein HY843_06345 [Bdellovibrio sp.]|nr:hypothetical protein [Bdellovibrio sp.]
MFTIDTDNRDVQSFCKTEPCLGDILLIDKKATSTEWPKRFLLAEGARYVYHGSGLISNGSTVIKGTYFDVISALVQKTALYFRDGKLPDNEIQKNNFLSKTIDIIFSPKEQANLIEDLKELSKIQNDDDVKFSIHQLLNQARGLEPNLQNFQLILLFLESEKFFVHRTAFDVLREKYTTKEFTDFYTDLASQNLKQNTKKYALELLGMTKTKNAEKALLRFLEIAENGNEDILLSTLMGIAHLGNLIHQNTSETLIRICETTNFQSIQQACKDLIEK